MHNLALSFGGKSWRTSLLPALCDTENIFLNDWIQEFNVRLTGDFFTILAQITCIKKPKGGCPGSVPQGRARQDGQMSQEVAVAAPTTATADKASGHVLVPCKPAPFALCVSMNCQLPLNMGNNFFNTRKPHPCSPAYIQLCHRVSVIRYQVLSFSFSCCILAMYRYIQRKCFWGRRVVVVRVFLICESFEMRGLELEMLLEVPPTYISGQPR